MSDELTADDVRDFDLRRLPAGFYDDPFPWYRALRRFDPMHRCPDGSLLLTRYADCAAVYRDPRFLSDKRRLFKPLFGDGALYQHHTTSLVFNDPPYHTRVRQLLADALKPRTVRAMQPVLEELVARLLEHAAASATGTVDLLEQYAAQIPLEVIGNLLTVPRDERGPLRGWSLSILGALEADLSAQAREAGNRAVEEFCTYLRDLIRRRRQSGQGDDTDILSVLIASHDRGELSEPELLHNCIFLLNAGHETTTNLIGNGVDELLRHPAQLDSLRRNPDSIKSAVEEILRFQSPNQIGNREVGESLEFNGMKLERGMQIVLCIGAANRDPERYENPEAFDITRHPNPHLAFVTGPHSCIGMTLARLEGQIALKALFDRFPAIKLVGTAPRQHRGRFRGFSRLPVRLQ